jgi:hypothetical protein
VRGNPFRITLLAIASIALAIALILLVRGTNSPPQFEGDHPPFDGTILAWGGAFGGLAVMSFLLWLTASANAWATARSTQNVEGKPR